MSHTGAWWILGFQPYKPNRSLTTSMLRCSKRQISFSFVFDWKRATGNMKNSTFWKRSFWRRFLCRVLWRLHRSPWKLAEKVIVGARKETPLWGPRFSFAFTKNSSLTGTKHACFGSQRGGESSTSEAGLKKRLYVLPRACWRASANGSVAAAARWLFL